MQCPICGSNNVEGARFCDQCAAPMATAACPACGLIGRPGAKFCSGCSAPLEISPADSANAKNDSNSEGLRAERRHLTVLFCDVAGSTELAAKLDPEDWQRIITSYHNCATETVARFGGHVALYLGDGLLVFFGYPQANEDDPQRAVMAGLALIDAIAALNSSLAIPAGRNLAVRVGIHSGAVVVADGSRRRANVFGSVPNIASHVQSLTAPNTVLITAAVHHLVSGIFVVEDAGMRPLKGVEHPLQLYRVIQASGARGRLAASAAAGLTSFVGRDDELRVLNDRWNRVLAGEGQVVLIIGEPGIGKSRLLQHFSGQLAGIPHMRADCAAASLHKNTPFYGVEDMLHQALHLTAEQKPEEHLSVLEASLELAGLKLDEAVPLIAPLVGLPVPAKYPRLELEPEQRRKRLLGTITGWALGIAKIQPLVIASEDLHWADPSTLEVIRLLAEQGAAARVLLICTGRPEFRAPWSLGPHHTQLTLNRLSVGNAHSMVSGLAPLARLDPATVEAVVERSGGVPLFVEQLTRSVVESSSNDSVRREIPATLYDSLLARLDRLGEAREIAQVASVIGPEFSWKILQAVTELRDEKVSNSLKTLTEAQLLSERGSPPEASYTFRHALIADAAYQSLLRGKRQQYHARIAEVLAERPPEHPDAQPQLLAHHYTEAGLAELAIPQWLAAGQMAVQSSASAEAVNHLTRGLEVLKTLPVTPERFQQELTFQLALGTSLIAIKGYASPEVGAVYARARELCHQAGEAPQLFPVLWGLWLFYTARANHLVAYELAEHCLRLAERNQDPILILEAHHALGITLTGLADFDRGLEHLHNVISRYDQKLHGSMAFTYGQDPKVVCLSQAAWTTWIRGYPDRAIALNQQAVSLAQNLAHPYTLATALNFAAMLHQFCRDAGAVSECAEIVIDVSTKHNFGLMNSWASLMQGWSMTQGSEIGIGIAQIRDGIAAFRSSGAEVMVPYFLSLLAEALGKTGKAAEAVSVLTQAQAVIARSHEFWWEAELYRSMGELRLLESDDQGSVSNRQKEAEEYFLQALNIASRQGEKSLELRAAMSLSELWRQQGKKAEAHRTLADSYGWFKEGFETADLRRAKTILDATK